MEREAAAEVAASEFEDSYEDERTLRGAILGEPLGSVPRREMLTVAMTATVAEVIRAMNERHVGCAVVVDGTKKLVGIFTERDVLRRVAGSKMDLHGTPVSEVMTRDPDVLGAEASIAYALREMSREGYRHIPLVGADHRPVGVVAVRDIVSWMVKLFPESVLNLPPEPGFPKNTDGG